MLNTFVRGPLDGRVISTAELLNPGVGQVILDYMWTKELIPTRSGEPARVWQYKHSLSAEVAQQVSTPETPSQEESKMAEDVQFTALEQARREAGISRQQLADRIGGALGTVSKVYRIERAGDDSKRTTDEERSAYTEALNALVAEKEAKAQADAAAAAEKAAAEPVEEPADETPAPAEEVAAEDPNEPAF